MRLHFLMTYEYTMTVFLRARDDAKIVVDIDHQRGEPKVTVMWISGRRSMSTPAGDSERDEALALAQAIDWRTLRQADSSPNIWEPS